MNYELDYQWRSLRAERDIRHNRAELARKMIGHGSDSWKVKLEQFEREEREYQELMTLREEELQAKAQVAT